MSKSGHMVFLFSALYNGFTVSVGDGRLNLLWVVHTHVAYILKSSFIDVIEILADQAPLRLETLRIMIAIALVS